MVTPTPQGDAGTDASADTVTETLTGAVAAAFGRHARRQQLARADPYALTMSKLGGCTKEAAYRLAGTPVSDPQRPLRESRQAALATWEHAGLLPELAAILGGTTRHEVDLRLSAGDDVILGRADLIWPEGKTLVDLKTLHSAKLNRVASSARPYVAHRLQVGGYALAAVQAGLAIEWAAWAYMDRESGEDRILAARFDDAFALEVLERVWEIQRWRRNPDEAPREGPLVVCADCPWHLRCLGEPVDPAPARHPLPRYDDPQTAFWLRRYDEARAQITELQKRRDFARAMFTRRPPGVYGDLEWEVTDPPPGSGDDPQKPRKGRLVVRAARDGRDGPRRREPAGRDVSFGNARRGAGDQPPDGEASDLPGNAGTPNRREETPR
jgi:hypothetical protein